MKKITSYDPSNNEPLGEVEQTTTDELRQIIKNAHTAQKEWRNLSSQKRADYVSEAFKVQEKSIQDLAILLAREMGKDYRRAYGEVGGAIQTGMYLPGEVVEAVKVQNVHSNTELHYSPLGVCGIISPWNYPVMMATNLIIPALVAGNTVVLKPSEETFLIAAKFFGTIAEYLPKDVLTIIYGDSETGKALVESEIQLIGFTGSKEVGKDIMARASGGLKRLVMELGGNDSMIVLEDANINNAARFAVAGSVENAGQMCTSVERIYVSEKIYEKFKDTVIEYVKNYKVGPWDMEDVNIGPIINKKQHEKIMIQVKDALNKGAFLEFGTIEQEAPFIDPIVLTNMNPNMQIEREETFGPVIAIDKFQDLDEVIDRANDSEYGLGAIVFGHSKAKEVAEKLDVGMVGINTSQGGANAPWVGAKQSGFGYHGTTDGHRQFTQIKVISR